MTNKQIGKSPIKIRAAFLLPLLSILLLSSCGNFKSIGVEKRHYRPGYSISANSVKTIPVKNIVTNENTKNTSERGITFTETQKREIPVNTEGHSSSLPDSHLKELKTIVSDRGKNITNKVKNVTMAPIHKAKSILKPEKIISNKATKASTEGKSYSLSTVLFVIGAIAIIWGLAVFFSGISIMSTAIAMALTIILGLGLVIVWGLIVLMVKGWVNGTNT